jgi:hypothetical protein
MIIKLATITHTGNNAMNAITTTPEQRAINRAKLTDKDKRTLAIAGPLLAASLIGTGLLAYKMR